PTESLMIENEIFDEKLLSIVAKFSRKHQFRIW
ncbi:uncharacterized protein METZ01_LOCUS292098, partial [marine metagenome]